jgi:hypothetical protein
MPDLKVTSAAFATLTAMRIASRVPGVRRLPWLQIIVLGQVVLLAREHLERLTPSERHRVVVLVRECHGRVDHLPPEQRSELGALIAKIEPRLFATTAVRTLSPLPLPGKVKLKRR